VAVRVFADNGTVKTEATYITAVAVAFAATSAALEGAITIFAVVAVHVFAATSAAIEVTFTLFAVMTSYSAVTFARGTITRVAGEADATSKFFTGTFGVAFTTNIVAVTICLH
jgi:hypothetical protein